MAQISRLQYLYLMLWVVLGTGITALPAGIAQFTVRDGWMVPFFFFFGVVVTVMVVVGFVRTFPNQSLMEGFQTAFGLWPGRVAGMWLVGLFFIASGTVMRELSIFVEVTSLPRTPLYVISAVIAMPIIYGVFHGLEVVGRLAEFLTPVALIFTFALFLVSLQNIDLSQLRPILANGWTPILRASILPATTFQVELIVTLQFVKSLQGGKTVGRDLLIVGAFLTLTGTLIEGIIISVLGSSATYLALPVGEVIRGIRIGQFVERLDTIYVMGVIATMVLKISVLIYVLTSAMKDVFRLPTIKNIAWPTGVAVWAANVALFRNAPDVNEFILYTTPAYFGFSLLGLPFVAMVFHRISRVFGIRRD